VTGVQTCALPIYGLDVLLEAFLAVTEGSHQLGSDPFSDVVDQVLSAEW
jgi:hypothetical protein